MPASLQAIARRLDDPAGLAAAVDGLIAARAEPPALLALGEPTHGIAAFPLLRNELLCHLVERGYRSIVLETDVFAASVVDDYVGGGSGDLDSVLAGGFSHGFGAVPGNPELVAWLRAHNAGRAARERVRFYGFDAPVEYSGAPSPRRALTESIGFLPAALRPVGDLDALLGDDAEWSNPAAMYDPAASIGNSDRAGALRVVADDVASTLRRAAPTLHSADPDDLYLALAHARTAQGLLRFHAAMARPGDDRIPTLLSVRAEMMADNLLAIADRERRRGPALVFAHNVHLRRAHPSIGHGTEWCGAGALVASALRESYVVIAVDGSPHGEPGTMQGLLADASLRRALFPASDLRAALPASVRTGEPMVRGHIPLTPEDLDRVDAVVFVADTDGKQYEYW